MSHDPTAPKECPWLSTNQWARLTRTLREGGTVDTELCAKEWALPISSLYASAQLLVARGLGVMSLRIYERGREIRRVRVDMLKGLLVTPALHAPREWETFALFVEPPSTEQRMADA